jgi:hypothetical protein
MRQPSSWSSFSGVLLFLRAKEEDPMKRPDPRILRAEKLLTEIGRLLAEIRAGVPAPRAQPKRRRRYKLPSILAALRDGASLDAVGDARDPRLPSRNVLAKYRKTNRAFDREARALLKERGRAASRVKGRIAPNPGATVAAARMPGQQYDWNAIAATDKPEPPIKAIEKRRLDHCG